jgi:hypothetical protein
MAALIGQEIVRDSRNAGYSRTTIWNALQALAREHTDDAITALAATPKNPGERVTTANILFAYGYGRPLRTRNSRVIRSIEDLTGALGDLF